MKKISLIVIVFILGGTVLTSELKSEKDFLRKELDIINGKIFIFIFFYYTSIFNNFFNKEIICEQLCQKGITMNEYGCTCNNTDGEKIYNIT